jgi:2-keto-3-deoxy-L-rhamnonate aldolase RhmA
VSINNVEQMRQCLVERQVSIGIGVSFSDPAVSELIAEAGYDFSWIDMEHGPYGLQEVLQHVVAHRGTNTAPFVRVPHNDVNAIKPILDLAPAGIIVPQVNSAAEAEAAVVACRYPPRGVRGYGPRRGVRYGAVSQADYLEQAADNPILAIQIEHTEAVRNIEEMLEVKEVDIFCLGPNDLSGSMGKLGQIDDPEVVAAIERVAEKVTAAGRTVGISTFYSAESYARWLQLGMTWLNLNVDWATLFSATRDVLEKARAGGGGK